MFKFLKDKLKKAVSVFSKAEEPVEEPIEELQEEIQEGTQEVEEIVEQPIEEPIGESEDASDEGESADEDEDIDEGIDAPEDDAAEDEPVESEVVEPEVIETEKPVETAVVEEVAAEEVIEPAVEAEPVEEVSEVVEEIEEPVEVEEKVEKVSTPLEGAPKPKAEVKQPKVAEPVKQPEPARQKKGLFSRFKQALTTTKIDAEKFEELFWELQVALLESNVAVEVIEKIKTDLEPKLVDVPLARNSVATIVHDTLKQSLQEVLEAVEPFDLFEKIKEKKPYVICFVGINGSGKTTSIAKVAHMLKQQGHSLVLAAGDTFRAAAIEQLELHANKLDIKLIKHTYGADPAAVAFDAIAHAKAAQKDVVLIDTAGRLHTNTNLLDEMKKIIRIAKPDLKIFVGESITGNDCVFQAQQFDKAVGIDGVILSKADVDEKGGTALSVGYVLHKPILYLGMGQEYEDLQPFNPQKILDALGI